MEEWVGLQWHRWIERAARTDHATAAVQLPAVSRALGVLYRAAGGASATRIRAASPVRVGGPRTWLQRLAGAATHAALACREAQTLALPPRLAVFDAAPLNRSLYQWLAVLAACQPDGLGWVASNQAATARALERFPGLRPVWAALLQAHLAQRPDPASLHGAAAAAELRLRQALQGLDTPCHGCLLPQQVAPVWLWLAPASATSAGLEHGDTATGANPGRPAHDARQTHRRAQAVRDERDRAPLLLPSRAESLWSWADFVRVNRASDDTPDPQAGAVADDLEQLAVAPDGRATAARVRFDWDLPSAAADDLPLGPGEHFPEWDYRRHTLQPEHCTVQVRDHASPPPFVPSPALRATAARVRRRMEVLRARSAWQGARADGEELDLDAWVRHQTTPADQPRTTAPAVYRHRSTTERSLATLLLADLSLSTDAYATAQARVIDIIRDALYVLGDALHASGDAFALYGFSSVRREHVRLQHLKAFAEPWAAPCRDRVGAIKPGYYTRMGAALRKASALLQARPERQRLLLLLTDGKPNDLDVYEGRYGLEDTRHAVQAARAQGLLPLAITIDQQAHDYLPLLFGRHGYVRVHRPQDLPARLADLHQRLTRVAG